MASPGRLGLEAWAKRYIRVPDGPHAGKPFTVRRAPWRQILRDMTSPQLEQISIRASVQSGKTAALILAALFHLSRGRSVLLFEPDEVLQRHLAERIQTFALHSTDGKLIEAFSGMRSPFKREHEDGGRLEVLNAAARGAGLSRTADVVVVDELRAFQTDMLQVLTDRMAAYGGKGKLITASSAGFEGDCRTTSELQKSDFRMWFMRCGDCGQESIARWEAVTLAKGGAPASYSMPCCGVVLDDAGLAKAVQAGRWKPTRKPTVARTRGYALSAIDGSPFETLATLDRAWSRAVAQRKLTGSMAEIRDFQTGRLALPFSAATAGGVTPEKIAQTCTEDYDASKVPGWASVVIASVDVQDNRLEVETSAWGAEQVEEEEEATSIRGWDAPEFKGLRYDGKWFKLRRAALRYEKLRGDPGQPEIWDALATICEEPIPHESGVQLRPAVTGVDTGGHYASMVSEFVKARGSGHVCMKGLSSERNAGSLSRMSVTVDSLTQYGEAGLMLVATSAAKHSIFSMLRASIAGDRPRALVWPQDQSRYGVAEFEGVCSESLERVLDRKTGATRLHWRKVRRDNEMLDLLVYSLALVSYFGVSFLLSEADAIEAESKRMMAA